MMTFADPVRTTSRVTPAVFVRNVETAFQNGRAGKREAQGHHVRFGGAGADVHRGNDLFSRTWSLDHYAVHGRGPRSRERNEWHELHHNGCQENRISASIRRSPSQWLAQTMGHVSNSSIHREIRIRWNHVVCRLDRQ